MISKLIDMALFSPTMGLVSIRIEEAQISTTVTFFGNENSLMIELRQIISDNSCPIKNQNSISRCISNGTIRIVNAKISTEFKNMFEPGFYKNKNIRIKETCDSLSISIEEQFLLIGELVSRKNWCKAKDSVCNMTEMPCLPRTQSGKVASLANMVAIAVL